MGKIRVLPPEIVNRIAAGEVVERPASIIKELVENAVDAHATEITIELEEGGKSAIVVRDNGSGIEADDLPLAFESHATSKLVEEEALEGLFGVRSLGFRGEALASIAAVAEVEIVSRTPQAPHAYRYSPSRREPPAPAPGAPGTVVICRNLFHNVAARRKFLRSTSTELSHAVEQVTRLALGFPPVAFRLFHKGRRVLDLPARDDLRGRLEDLLGPEKAAMLAPVEECAGELRLTGFAGLPDLRRSDTRWQHFFVNGRWVRDRLLAHALRSAYQGFLIPGLQPVAYLFLDCPPALVDANVHPTKTEVRFRDPSSVYPLVFHAVRRVLEAAPVAIRAAPETGAAGSEVLEARERVAQAALDFLSSERAGSPASGRPRPRGSAGRSGRPSPSRSGLAGFERTLGEAAPARGAAAAAGPAVLRRASRRAFQLLNAYIVVEDGDGVVVIDQHALHEKILFEELETRVLEGEPLSQKLLVPEIVELEPQEMALLEDAAALLEPCGFAVEPFGEQEAAVHAVPKPIAENSAGGTGEILRAVLARLREEGGSVAAWGKAGLASPDPLSRRYREILSLVACKKAVKAGTPLSDHEIEGLLERADLAADPRYCPHGRPVAVRLGRAEIERRFDRK